MKVIIFTFIILLSFCSIVNADLDFTKNYDYIHINSACLISNAEQSVEIPIYSGLNMIAIPLYPKNPTLNAVFGDNPVNFDVVERYVNDVGYQSATYYGGTWWDADNVEPIEPTVGYKYERAGANFTAIVKGTFLPKDNNCSIYTYFNFKNMVGTNIIRPKRSRLYD